MGYNSGFSRANNKGLKLSKGEYVLFLNPDTIIKEGFVTKLISFYESKSKEVKLGLLGSRIKTIDGKELLIGSRNGYPNLKRIALYNPLIYKLNQRWKWISLTEYNPYIKHYENHPIDYLSGACLLFDRKKFIQQDLFMDEDFFLYSEDLEWSYRIKKSGLVNYFCAEAEVYHINSGSTDSLKDKKHLQITLSRLLYIYKCYGFIYFNLYCLIVKYNTFTFWIASLLKISFDIEKEQKMLNKVVSEKYFTILINYIIGINKKDVLRYD